MKVRVSLQVQINSDGQRTVMIEGGVDAEAAWEMVKWLEGLGPEDFPLILDLSRARSIHWLAVEILNGGVQSLSQGIGPIHLRFGPGITKIHG